jgi:hypothetical protein
MERHIAVTLESGRFTVWAQGKEKRERLRTFAPFAGADVVCDDLPAAYVAATRWASCVAITLGLTAQTIRASDEAAPGIARQIAALTREPYDASAAVRAAVDASFAHWKAQGVPMVEVETDVAEVVRRTGIDADSVARVLACLPGWDALQEVEP